MFMISGGPGAGKTTLLAELHKLGYSTAPEVARQIIQEQVKSGGDALPWADKEGWTPASCCSVRLSPTLSTQPSRGQFF